MLCNYIHTGRSRGPRAKSRPPQDPDERLRWARHNFTRPDTVTRRTSSRSRQLPSLPVPLTFCLTGSAHHRSRSEGTLRRFLSPLTHHHHDATVRQHQSARPSPIPHRMRDRTMTPSSRRLREQIPKVWGYGSWRRQAAGTGTPGAAGRAIRSIIT